MSKPLLSVGLDVHAKNITIALAQGEGEARPYGTSGGNGARSKHKESCVPNAALVQVFNLFAAPPPPPKGKKKV